MQLSRMLFAYVLTAFALAVLIALAIIATCGAAARRILILLLAFVGVPLGVALDLNSVDAASLLWVLSGAVAAACLALTDSFALQPPMQSRPRQRTSDSDRLP